MIVALRLGDFMRVRILLLAAVLASLSFQSAFAEKRVALVIGNSAYKTVPKLANPENDASAIGLLFKKAGFDSVDVRQNLANVELRKVVRDFSETTKDADIAVVFFAGHGIEVSGINYLIPIDSALKRDVDVDDEAVSLERVLSMLEPARKLRLVILDACRDNPFAANMTRTMAGRSVGRGLARIETPSSETLIAYAARAGSIALDGQGPNSPFTLALLKHLTTPGLDVRLAFGRIRDDVLATTNKKQEPFVYGALGGATVTLAALSPAERPGTSLPADRSDADVQASRDYEKAANVGTREAWESFLKKHPAGFYADLARAQLGKLTEGTASKPPPNAQPFSPPVRPAQPRSGKPSYATNYACCLNYYRGERSLEGYAPPERCRRNMAAVPNMDFCTGKIR
jgi:hypothetical protein